MPRSPKRAAVQAWPGCRAAPQEAHPRSPPALAGAAALTALAALGASPARAQSSTLLPATGLDTVRIGDLRDALGGYLSNAPARTIERNWQINASLGVDVGLTDNAFRVESPRRFDAFTLITPTIGISGNTARIQANAVYSPAISVYANNSSQSRVDHFGQAGALVTLVPDTLFLDLRGSISETSLTGGLPTTYQQGFNRNNQVTSLAFSATPYVQHRFGGWGTAVASYSIAQTIQDTPYGNNGFVVVNTPGVNTVGGTTAPVFYGSNGDLTTQREQASFTTGENFGRLNDLTIVSATQYSGTGTYRGAYRNEVSTTVGYAVTRSVTAIGAIGYQDLRFGGIPPYRLNQGLWSVGGRYNPSPNLTATLTYGRRDGITAFNADAAYYPTARTALFVRYSTGLTSDAENLQNVLSNTNVSATGLLVDRTTGAPVSTGLGFSGTQNNLFQLRRLSVTGLLNLDRDSVAATLTNEQRTTVTNTVANASGTTVPAGVSTSSTFGTITWSHQLSERLSSNVTASYGVNDNGNALGLGSGTQTSFSGAAQLSYIFGPTLTGRVLYSYTNVSGNGVSGIGTPFVFRNGGFTENALLAGLRKSF